MLDIRHIPSATSIPANRQPLIQAEIHAFDNSGINPDSLKLFYSTSSRIFNSVNMYEQIDHHYQGLLPTASNNDTIYYYIKAVSNNSKVAFEPLIADADPHYIVIDEAVESELYSSPETITLNLSQDNQTTVILAITNSAETALSVGVILINEGADY